MSEAPRRLVSGLSSVCSGKFGPYPSPRYLFAHAFRGRGVEHTLQVGVQLINDVAPAWFHTKTAMRAGLWHAKRCSCDSHVAITSGLATIRIRARLPRLAMDTTDRAQAKLSLCVP